MAQRYSLQAEARTLFGKQVKQLRRASMVPANIYGHNVDPIAISLPLTAFAAAFRQAGETGLIDLTIDGQAARPVLIHSTAVDPVHGQVLHVDFYQVNLKEKLIATVPLEFVGESPIVKNKEGILLELLQEVEVESLPTDIPSKIEVDVSGLTELDQGIHVGDLPVPAGVEMKTDTEELVCKIETAQMAEEEEEVAPEGESTEAEVEASADPSEDAPGNE